MCTALVHHEPGAEWPLQVAFVRDEDRDRETLAPARWWEEQPTAFGARDARAGGTWLAVDLARRSLAFVQNQIGPHVTFPDARTSPSRGRLPLAALRGAEFDLRAEELAGYQPFHLLAVDGDDARWWQWSGTELTCVRLQPGLHLVASRGTGMPGERERRARLLERFAAAATPRPALELDPADAWGEWLELLDGRDARPDDLGGLVVHSVAERPGFGTVGATLVALAADGRVRYDVNDTTTVDPGAWSRIEVESANVPVR